MTGPVADTSVTDRPVSGGPVSGGPDSDGHDTDGPGSGRWHYRRSLASRVILLTTMAVGLSVAFVAVGAYFTVRMQLQSSLDDSLLNRAAQTSTGYDVKLASGEVLPLWALVATDLRVAVVNSDGTVLADRMGGFPQLGRPELAVARGNASSSIRTISYDGTRYRVVSVPNADAQALVIAQSLHDQETVLAKLGIVTLLFGVAGMIAAGIAGWAVARSGLRPVRRLTGAVEDIARTEDLTPLPVEGADEIARLAAAFNKLLTSVAASRDRQRELVADAGHELRTPLTSLRTNLDLLTQADGPGGHDLPPGAREELLDDVRAQIEELSNLVGDLVELARDEPLTHIVEEVELHETLDHAVARVRRRAPGVAFEVDARPWFVVGESAALERALTNLLDNAAKWSPVGGTVHVSLVDGVVTVDDEGDGIAEEDLTRVFDRFYRSTESRSMPGSGLGLSIVRQAAERHAGTVVAGRSPAGGARLVLRVPGSTHPVPAGPPVRTPA